MKIVKGLDRNIVAIDDDPIFLKLLGRKLAGMAVSYHPYSNVEDARQYIHQYQPWWLFIDFRIPPYNGYSIYNELEAESLIEESNVSIMSSEIIPDLIETSCNNSNVIFLLKDWLISGDNLENRLNLS